ncbi:VOC family protein [Streptomyces sp. N35]|uniref:VOC family protein n=1 Tax=Streptomyces sp. N35 TaxID=2795730 RepID=UPI0018F54527|nr:VOC family protein [Streptomyces sp. N35]
MSSCPDGTPIWADAMFPDPVAAQHFYSELLGWTYGEPAMEYGGYTQAYSQGKAVAGLVPPMPGADAVTPSWNLYLAVKDIDAKARAIQASGGEPVMEPMKVGEFGTMLLAKDPSGVHFSVWQPGTHKGFEKQEEPGAFCWAEVTTRDAAAADAFFAAVFGYESKRIDDDALDFHLWNTPGSELPALGRLKMDGGFPAEVPPFINTYFAVEDCDAALATVREHGGMVHFGPVDSPFGRFATVSDPQGATFSVVDLTVTQGDVPKAA